MPRPSSKENPFSRTLRTTTGALAVFGVVVLTALGSTSPAAAAADPKPPILTVTGDGTWTTDDTAAAVVTGPAEVRLRKSGDPLPATLTAVLTPEDGTLPDPETCEPASARFTVDGVRAARMTLAGTGTVCGVYPQSPTYVVTQVFTGRYTVIDAGRCKLRGVRRVVRGAPGPRRRRECVRHRHLTSGRPGAMRGWRSRHARHP